MMIDEGAFALLNLLDPTLNPWKWLIYAALFFLFELISPALFFIWPGLGALTVGALCFAFPIPWAWQLALFSFAAGASALLLRRFLATTLKGGQDDPPMPHQRDKKLIGRRFHLDRPIAGGRGRTMIDGLWWIVAGDDCPAGTRLEVKNADGGVLIVAPPGDDEPSVEEQTEAEETPEIEDINAFAPAPENDEPEPQDASKPANFV